MPSVLPAALLALFAACALVLGSALPTIPFLHTRFFARHLSLLIGFSAGLMLATALHELLPEALEKSHDRAMWGAGCGFLALYMAERLTHFHACRHRECEIDEDAEPVSAPEEPLLPVVHHAEACRHPHHVHDHSDHDHHHHAHHSHHGHGHSHLHGHLHAPPSGHADMVALVGMSIHNFADGLTTAAAFSVSQPVGVVVLLAIVLHQMAAGLSLGAIMLRVGRDRRRVLLSTAISASFILWGALFYSFVVPIGPEVQGIVLGIAGGSFLYVAACDLLPEAHAADEGWFVTATTLFGYLFAVGVKSLFGGHSH